MHEFQHLSQKIEGFFSVLSRYPSLEESVASAKRILTPWNGEGRIRNIDEYRIVERNKRGKIVATYTAVGELIETQSPKPQRRRVPVAA